MPQFDVAAALRDGHSIQSIAEFLGKEKKFDVASAIADGHDPWAIIQELNKPEPGLAQTFTGGIKRSIGELGVLAGDVLPAMVAQGILSKEDAEAYAAKQFKEAEKTRSELEAKYPTQYKSYKDVEDLRSGIGYVAERAGELVPDVVPSLITGGIGYGVGRKIASSATEKALKEYAERTGKDLLEEGAEKAAAEQMKNMADDVGLKAAEELSRKYATRGINTGVFLGSYAQNAPEIFENIYQETGDLAAGGALLFGGLSAMLDSYLPAQLLNNLGAYGKAELVAKMLKDSGAKPAVWKSILKEGGKAALGEGLTESAQETISALAERIYGSEKEVFAPENIERYLESFFAGAAGGGALGSVSGVVQGLREKAAARGDTSVAPTDLKDIEQISEEEAQSRLAGVAPLTPAQEQKKQELLLLGYTPQQAEATVQGGADVTGTEQRATGESPIILGGPGPADTAGGVAAPQDRGVDVSAAGVTGAGVGEGGVSGALEGDRFSTAQIQIDIKEAIDAANATRAELRKLQASNVGLLDKKYKNYTDARDILKDIQAGKIKVDPAPFEREVELADRLAAEDERVGILTNELIKFGERAGAPGAPSLAPTTPLAETTETGEVIPAGPGERLVIQEDGTYGPAPAEMTGPQPAYIVDQKDGKVKIQNPDGTVRSLKKDEQTTAKQTIAEAFVPHAKEFGFTTFNNLPKEQRQAFLRSLALGYSPRTAVKLTSEYRADPIAFEDNYGKITDLAPKPLTKPKTMAARIDREKKMLELTEEQSRQRAVREAEVEKSIAEQPVGKGAEVDSSVMQALKDGDINGALDALIETAEDIKNTPGSATLVRAIASTLKNVGLKSKIEFNQILESDRYAEYDPVTDTIRVSKFEPLDQTTLLHELSHAGTVRVLYLYDTGKVDQLTPEQIRGVQQLYTMMDYAKKRIVLPQYQKAFENIYEFVAYAVTDPRFQAELGRYKSPIVRDRSLWNMIADAVARILGLDEGTGTLATDVVDVFGEILSVPDPSQRIDLAALPARGTTQTAPQRSIKDIQNSRLSRMENQKPGAAMYTRNLKKTFTRHGATEFVRKMQNERIWAKKFQDFLTDTGQLISVGDDKNNLDTLLTLSAGEAKAIHQKYLYEDMYKAEGILQALVKATGNTVEQVLNKLHDYAIVLHDPERRRVRFLREAPLVSDTADTARQKILEEVLKIDRTDPDAAKAQAQKLRADLEALVAANLDTNSDFSKEDHSKYNSLGEYSYEQIDELRNDFKKDPNKGLVFAYFDKLKKIQDTTVELNRQANYFSNPVNNLVDFYGFRNYFSFKGKPESQARDYQADPLSPQISGELQEAQYAFEGRISESDNPMLNTINEATRAAMRLGRKDVTQAIKNISEADPKLNPKGQGLIKAKVKKRISFEDRFNDNYDSGLKRGENTIFHYNPDGSIDIIEINQPEIRNAIRRPFREPHPVLDLANRITSAVGQGHTRYNPAFAPVDFTRNLLTYAGIISAEYGMRAGGDVIKQISRIIADGGMNKTRKFSLAFANGDMRTIEKMIQEDKTGFYADIANYFQKGGRVSYIQGLSYKDNLIDAVRGVGQNGILKNKEQIDKFMDAWLDMFEMTTRVAAYRTIKQQNLAKGMSPEAADVEAIAYAKNLANFEQVGEWGKTIGAFYMFFRPAATGAVRAIQALAPAFDFSTDTEILERAKNMTMFGGASEQEAMKYLANFKAKRDNARTSALAILGMGATVYIMAAMMTGEDEEDRNKTVTDDMARWVRFARFNTGIKVAGQDLVIQLPWGFGLGALASTGAQITSVAFGGQGMLDAMNNIMDATFESFLPLPASKINKFDYPAQWAVDSITPSVLRPLLEFSMNMDGLGRQIYNNRQSRYNDAYTGGDNIPQIFKDAAAFMYDTVGVDASPNTLYFFANNYLDGVARVAATTWGIGNVMVGRKDFDPRTDTFLLDAYIKGPSNYDARQFAKVEEKIKDMERDYKSIEGTDRMGEYLAEHPYDKQVIDFYNSYVNGSLRNLREQANTIRRDRTLSPQDKKDAVRLLVEQQNRVKSAFVTAMKGFEIEP